MPLRAKAAAKGAVIAEDIPAANKPKPRNMLAESPNKGCRAGAISAALCKLICLPKNAEAAVESTATEINAPSGMEINRSFLAVDISSIECHF